MTKCQFSKIFAFLATGALIAGCAQFEPAVRPVATEPDLIGERIAQSAEKAAAALDEIAGIEQHRTPVQQVPDYLDAPTNFTQPITVKWTGPVDQIVRTLANMAGATLSIKGKTPPVPVLVNVDVYQESLIQVLRDIGLQAGSRADLSVDSQHSNIEIRYAPSDR